MTVQTDTSTTLKEAAANSLDKTSVPNTDGNTAGPDEQPPATIVDDEQAAVVVAAHKPDEQTNAVAANDASVAAASKSELYAQFRQDPEKMQQMEEFVNGLLDSAGKEAEVRQAASQVR